MRYVFLVGLVLSGFFGKAQSIPKVLAENIAQRMHDSLHLTPEQREDVYQLNLALHKQKAAVWQRFNPADTLLRRNLQKIENTRDSLYGTVLTEEQMVLYRQKKRNLVTNKE